MATPHPKVRTEQLYNCITEQLYNSADCGCGVLSPRTEVRGDMAVLALINSTDNGRGHGMSKKIMPAIYRPQRGR